MKKRVLIIGILFLILIGLALYLLVEHPNGEVTGIPVSGTIEVTQVELSFKIPGRLSQRLVDEGNTVHTGQHVAMLDRSDQELQVRQATEQVRYAQAVLAELEAGSRTQEILSAEAELERARAGLNAAQSQRTLAQADHDRFEKLHEQGVVSPREYEFYKTQLDVARNSFEEARARVEAATQHLSLIREGPRAEKLEQARTQVRLAQEVFEKAKLQLEYTDLISPIDGVVLSKAAEPGEYLNPGSPVITVGEMDRVWLRAYVNETDLGKVKFGQRARVFTDTFQGREFQGTISYISSEAEFTPKSVQTHEERVKLVYRVKIEIENPDMILKPGMPADAFIESPQ
ncbi:MAG: efflux RND transporter periplasmic adaptor subunit [Desulfomonilia bacterium]